MPTVDGLLRNSKVYCSKSKESLTRSHKKQEEVKVTLSFVLLMLHLLFQWQAYLITPALSTDLNVDDTGNTFAGVLNGRVKVYIDPYAGVNYMTVGYRGSNPYDAGMFYCPYVPLQMVRAVGENTFQPKIGFKTRYGMVSNPFVGSTPSDGLASDGTNQYYRKISFNIL